jgi:hypothetical protein
MPNQLIAWRESDFSTDSSGWSDGYD